MYNIPSYLSHSFIGAAAWCMPYDKKVVTCFVDMKSCVPIPKKSRV